MITISTSTASIPLIVALHHLLQQLLVLRITAVVLANRSVRLLHHQLLDPVRISQSVQRVFARTQTGRDHRYHACLALLADKRIAQHLRQLGHAERQMRTLATERPDTLLERQQRLVNLGTLHARLAIRRRCVRSAFVASQIDEREFTVNPTGARWPQHDLEHGVRPRRVRVGRRLAGRPRTVAVLNDLQHLVHTVHHALRQSDHLHLLLAVLQHSQLLLVRQQIKHFAAVNLKETGRHHQIQVAETFAV